MSILPKNRAEAGSVDQALLERCTRSVTRAAATFAGFCEHVEHNEPNAVGDVLVAARSLRTTACELAESAGLSLKSEYDARIEAVEKASAHRHVRGPLDEDLSGALALRLSTTWQEVQISQSIHDRQFHPDVFGLSKIDQMRHYTLHVAKLAGFMVDAVEFDDWRSFAEGRLADLAIFGVKIATVCNEKLPDTAVAD